MNVVLPKQSLANSLSLDRVLQDVSVTLTNISSKFKSSFYNDCSEYINSPDVIDEFNMSHMLKNKYIIEPFRLYFYREFSKFYFYIVDYNIDINDTTNTNNTNNTNNTTNVNNTNKFKLELRSVIDSI